MAGQWTELKAADGHNLDAWLAEPVARPRGAVVVIQEIFGVNHHIRGLAEAFAAEGYLAVAPAVYDRVERKVELGYGEADVARGRDIRGKVDWDGCMKDVAAAVELAAKGGKVGITGFCYGGGVAWVAAARVPGVAAASCYYGGPWNEFKDERVACPTLLHFGTKDQMIPLSLAEEMPASNPAAVAHIYEAEHGFVCDQRVKNYDATATTLARRRTMGLFAACLDAF